MSAKPEANFIRSINRLLPKEIYHEGMANPFRGGTPDRWYDGPGGDLWVEYKYLKRLTPKILPNLSALQLKWLNRAYINGRNVAVILGTPKGGYIYINRAWEYPMQRETFENLILTKKEVAQWIQNNVTIKDR